MLVNIFIQPYSEMTPEGKMKPTKIDSLMLNGNNICMVCIDILIIILIK